MLISIHELRNEDGEQVFGKRELVTKVSEKTHGFNRVDDSKQNFLIRA
jgi:hypothetical protein